MPEALRACTEPQQPQCQCFEQRLRLGAIASLLKRAGGSTPKRLEAGSQTSQWRAERTEAADTHK
eukprot:5700259-Prymnesium_polylepis.1